MCQALCSGFKWASCRTAPREADSALGFVPTLTQHTLFTSFAYELLIGSPSSREQGCLSLLLECVGTMGSLAVECFSQIPLPWARGSSGCPRGCVWLLDCPCCHLPAARTKRHLGAGCRWPSALALLPVATWLPQVLTSEDLEGNTRKHCWHPWHSQELKINGEELIVLNPQLHMSLANSLLEVIKAQWPGEARMPGTECNWPSIWDLGLNWHKLVNRDFKPRDGLQALLNSHVWRALKTEVNMMCLTN